MNRLFRSGATAVARRHAARAVPRAVVARLAVPGPVSTMYKRSVFGSSRSMATEATSVPDVAPTAAAAPTPAANPAPATSFRQKLTEVVDMVLAHPELSQKWARRIAYAAETDFDAPLRVLVVSEKNVSRDALINTLLDYPAGKPVLPEQWGAETKEIIKISKGEVWQDEAVDGVRRIKVPTPALPDIEWTIAPALPDVTDLSDLNTLVTKNDVILAVTDTARHLARSREAQFVGAHAHRSMVVAVTGIDSLNREAEELPVVLDAVRAQLGATRAVPVIGISTRRAAVAQYLAGNDPDAAATSGVPALRDLLATMSGSVEHRYALKARAALVTCLDALANLDATLNAGEAAVRTVDAAFQKRIVHHVVAEQNRLVAEFHDRDLRPLGESLGQIKAQIRTFFDQVPYWSLFYRLDRLALDLRAHLRSHVLSEAETRMAFAAGRLAEGLRYLYADVHAALGELRAVPTHESVAAVAAAVPKAVATNDAQSDATEPAPSVDAVEELTDAEPIPASDAVPAAPAPTASSSATSPVDLAVEPMRAVLDYLRDVVEKDQVTHGTLDPFILSNTVWKHRAQYEQGEYAETMRARAESLVIQAVLAQVGTAAATGFAVAQGVEAVYAVPAGIAVAISGMQWMKAQWGKLEEQFVRSTSEVQEGMRKDLLEQYHKLIDERLTVPLSNLADLYDQALTDEVQRLVDRLEQVRVQRARVQQMLGELQT
ncbi:hypothetical protein AMAG_08497 [Allomyces macrogynus ATCC 38327]|uniref:Uncharacterized protein n=1 Tax=Allomyces macrogynus (strain ATCC 38327) TaxID=578462 RepID=A0A0L0SLU4_ALLM3|nr:hypothetical protein AMAG_08497 [Allomyces macrogynus ATCC 38327]|eukprot:KNE63360.1 hypothetical protein AMAG_08497 [Allomyces macrogynus ATCC 38327]